MRGGGRNPIGQLIIVRRRVGERARILQKKNNNNTFFFGIFRFFG